MASCKISRFEVDRLEDFQLHRSVEEHHVAPLISTKPRVDV